MMMQSIFDGKRALCVSSMLFFECQLAAGGGSGAAYNACMCVCVLLLVAVAMLEERHLETGRVHRVSTTTTVGICSLGGTDGWRVFVPRNFGGLLGGGTSRLQQE